MLHPSVRGLKCWVRVYRDWHLVGVQQCTGPWWI